MMNHRPAPPVLLLVAAIIAVFAVAPVLAAAGDWSAYDEASVIEIVTVDPDGDQRRTKIWIVVLDDVGYIRTNASRWLENIRRDPNVLLDVGSSEEPFVAQIDEDEDTYVRVEEAFKRKYGFMQSIMSTFRMSRPTVLRVVPRTPDRSPS